MEEIQENSIVNEPEKVSENSNTTKTTEQQEGQASVDVKQNSATPAPSSLILGKFKSVEELTKAYKELEKFQGTQSEELGLLRQKALLSEDVNKAWEKQQQIEKAQENLKQVAQKYNSPQYFQDPSFREIYKEAYLALGENLDSDRFVKLIEDYVASRILAIEKTKAVEKENRSAIDAMNFSKNEVSSITPPKKRIDEMTQTELDELLKRLS